MTESGTAATSSAAGAGHRPENLVLGAGLITAAFLCVSLVGALAKESGSYTSTGVILLFQNAIGLLVVVPIALRGGWSAMKTQRIGLHVLRAAMGTACWCALFFAITQIPLANATLLTYNAPLWMPLIAWAVTRQRVAKATWIGAGIGFVGVLLVLGPEGQSFGCGSLAALAGALFLATAMMSVRWLGATEPVIRVFFYYFLLSTVLAVPIAAVDWQPIPAQAWGWLAALGCVQLASQALIDWIVWHHRPTLLACLGMVLVIGGGLAAVRARRSTKPQGGRDGDQRRVAVNTSTGCGTLSPPSAPGTETASR